VAHTKKNGSCQLKNCAQLPGSDLGGTNDVEVSKLQKKVRPQGFDAHTVWYGQRLQV
jgi:hypothetical protein